MIMSKQDILSIIFSEEVAALVDELDLELA